MQPGPVRDPGGAAVGVGPGAGRGTPPRPHEAARAVRPGDQGDCRGRPAGVGVRPRVTRGVMTESVLRAAGLVAGLALVAAGVWWVWPPLALAAVCVKVPPAAAGTR